MDTAWFVDRMTDYIIHTYHAATSKSVYDCMCAYIHSSECDQDMICTQTYIQTYIVIEANVGNCPLSGGELKVRANFTRFSCFKGLFRDQKRHL